MNKQQIQLIKRSKTEKLSIDRYKYEIRNSVLVIKVWNQKQYREALVYNYTSIFSSSIFNLIQVKSMENFASLCSSWSLLVSERSLDDLSSEMNYLARNTFKVFTPWLHNILCTRGDPINPRLCSSETFPQPRACTPCVARVRLAVVWGGEGGGQMVKMLHWTPDDLYDKVSLVHNYALLLSVE